MAKGGETFKTSKHIKTFKHIQKHFKTFKTFHVRNMPTLAVGLVCNVADLVCERVGILCMELVRLVLARSVGIALSSSISDIDIDLDGPLLKTNPFEVKPVVD